MSHFPESDCPSQMFALFHLYLRAFALVYFERELMSHGIGMVES